MNKDKLFLNYKSLICFPRNLNAGGSEYALIIIENANLHSK